MNRSDQINELAAALAKAQKVMAPAVKDVANAFFKSVYADLAAVVAACRIPLAENGLSYSQSTDFGPDGMWLETTLFHSSGQWLSSRWPLRPIKDDPQGLMSATTYARRGSLMALCGIVADDASDDDGNAASGHASAPAKGSKKELAPPAPQPDAVKKAAAVSWATDQIAALAGFTDGKKFEEWCSRNRDNIKRLGTLDVAAHERLIEAITDREALLNPANA